MKSVLAMLALLVFELPYGGARAANVPLTAVVGRSCTLSAMGIQVTTLKPGRYVVDVRDRSVTRRFRLWGPGLDRATRTSFVGKATWRIAFSRGTYRFGCSASGRPVQGSFLVK